MIISKTPLRASFFGGGTDFKDYYENGKYGYGTVLSAALNMYVYIVVNRRFDDKIRVCYTKNEFVDSVDQIKHNIIREALKIMEIEKGIDIVYSGDLPLSSAGVGLASSSAMAVGVLNALYAYKGLRASADQLAKKACEIEIDRLGNPIGIQDQYAVSHGGFNQYKFWQNGNVTVSPVVCNKTIMGELKKSFMLFYTGLTRVSSDILQEQKQEIHHKMLILDKMVEMVEEAYEILENGDIEKWGTMLDAGWKLKKQMASKISNPLIEEMYTTAKMAGAIGGKILGAGGGGFLLLLVPIEKQQEVKRVLNQYKLVPFDFEAEGSHIIFMEENRLYEEIK